MKKIILLAFLLLFSVAVLAYDLNGLCTDNTSSDLNRISDCIMKGSFGADPKFFALILILVFVAMAFAARVPLGASIAIGLMLTVGLMAPGMNFPEADLLLGLMIIIIGGSMAIMWFKLGRR